MPEETDFYARAERRIWRFQLVIGLAGAAAAWSLSGAMAAASFAAGGVISSLNFFWLKQAVDALVDKSAAGSAAPTPAARRKQRLLVAKFFARYLLLGLAGYVILKRNSWNVKALLAGLFLFVAATLAELAVEIITGFRSEQEHGT